MTKWMHAKCSAATIYSRKKLLNMSPKPQKRGIRYVSMMINLEVMICFQYPGGSHLRFAQYGHQRAISTCQSVVSGGS